MAVKQDGLQQSLPVAHVALVEDRYGEVDCILRAFGEHHESATPSEDDPPPSSTCDCDLYHIRPYEFLWRCLRSHPPPQYQIPTWVGEQKQPSSSSLPVHLRARRQEGQARRQGYSEAGGRLVMRQIAQGGRIDAYPVRERGRLMWPDAARSGYWRRAGGGQRPTLTRSRTTEAQWL